MPTPDYSVTLLVDATQGPPGPASTVPGPPGPGAEPFLFVQSPAVTPWAVQHNLDAPFPHVTVVDEAGYKIGADVHYIDNNNLIILFTVPVAGSAQISK